jgi:hypothetical protein
MIDLEAVQQIEDHGIPAARMTIDVDSHKWVTRKRMWLLQTHHVNAFSSAELQKQLHYYRCTKSTDRRS